DREAEAGERRLHELDLTDPVEADVLRARIGAELRLELLGGAADVASLGLHLDVRSALELVALDRDRSDRAPNLAVAAERDGVDASPDAYGDLRERVRIDDALSVVLGDDVIRLTVLPVDPHARRVD